MHPIIFLHGFLGKPSDWDPVISYLPPCSVFKVELPGHGTTPFTESFTLPLPSEKFHLVGYSMGGRLALQYAQRFPQQIASLVIASAHPGLKNDDEKKERSQRDRLWAEKLLSLSIDEFLSQWYDQPLFQSFKVDFSMRKDHNPEHLAKALLHYSLASQSFFKPKNALYLVGEKDEAYRSLYPEATVIENSGHCVHLENPKSVAEAIKKRIFS